ncbi:MAG: hypothetical protein J6Y03_00065 [Alphaproteobacteria bacterium]|nr:hypothetical protein [Alphaproteobacteria bacterium]
MSRDDTFKENQTVENTSCSEEERAEIQEGLTILNSDAPKEVKTQQLKKLFEKRKKRERGY